MKDERWGALRRASRLWRSERSLWRDVEEEVIEEEEVAVLARERGADVGREEDDEEEEMTCMAGKVEILSGRVGIAGGATVARGVGECEEAEAEDEE